MREKANKDSHTNKPHISAYAGDMSFMVAYIQAGGPPSQRSDDGDTILHAAAQGWQHRMVEYLLLAGADINAQDADGFTPLHTIIRSQDVPFDNGLFIRDVALEDARLETLKMLILHGADRTIRSKQGINPLHLSAMLGDRAAMLHLLTGPPELLEAKTDKGLTALGLAILGEHLECVKFLISMGASIDVTFPDGTPLRDLLIYKDESEHPSDG